MKSWISVFSDYPRLSDVPIGGTTRMTEMQPLYGEDSDKRLEDGWVANRL
jgi:hypothetical protein